jgi:hypothetical protein
MSSTDNVASNQSSHVRAAIARINELLVPGETLEATVTQRRIFALFHRRVVVGATTGRLIVLRRGMIGGFETRDMRWQDLKDAQLKVGIVGATLSVAPLTSSDLAMSEQATPVITITGLCKREAQKVYTISQAHEQEWREKRRVRELEELRAKSGGVIVGSSTSGIVGDSDSPVARLERANEMRDKGLIRDSEYEAIKAKLVSSL